MVERAEQFLYKEGAGRRSSIEVMDSAQDLKLPTAVELMDLVQEISCLLRTPVIGTPKSPEPKATPEKKPVVKRRRHVEPIACDVAEVPQAPMKKRRVTYRQPLSPVPCDLAEKKAARRVLGRSMTLLVCPPAPTSQRVRPLPYRLSIRPLDL